MGLPSLAVLIQQSWTNKVDQIFWAVIRWHSTATTDQLPKRTAERAIMLPAWMRANSPKLQYCKFGITLSTNVKLHQRRALSRDGPPCTLDLLAAKLKPFWLCKSKSTQINHTENLNWLSRQVLSGNKVRRKLNFWNAASIVADVERERESERDDEIQRRQKYFKRHSISGW